MQTNGSLTERGRLADDSAGLPLLHAQHVNNKAGFSDVAAFGARIPLRFTRSAIEGPGS